MPDFLLPVRRYPGENRRRQFARLQRHGRPSVYSTLFFLSPLCIRFVGNHFCGIITQSISLCWCNAAFNTALFISFQAAKLWLSLPVLLSQLPSELAWGILSKPSTALNVSSSLICRTASRWKLPSCYIRIKVSIKTDGLNPRLLLGGGKYLSIRSDRQINSITCAMASKPAREVNWPFRSSPK